MGSSKGEEGQLRNAQSIAFRQELQAPLGTVFMGNPFLGSHWHDTSLSYFRNSPQ